MRFEDIIQMLNMNINNKLGFEDYSKLKQMIEYIDKVDEETFKKMKRDIKDYYDFTLESFNFFGDYVQEGYIEYGYDFAKNCILERFSDDSFKYDMLEAKQSLLYEDTFKKIKGIFDDILNAWGKNKNVEEKFQKIDSVLKEIENLKNSILFKFRTKEVLKGYLYEKLKQVKIDVHNNELKIFGDNIDNLVGLIENGAINLEVDIKQQLFDKIYCNNKIFNMGVYRNRLSKIVTKSYALAEYIEINADFDEYYSLVQLLYNYVKNAVNYKDIFNYYKNYIDKNLNDLIGYNKNNNTCVINVSAIKDFFDIIDCVNLIFFICDGNIKLNYMVFDKKYVDNLNELIEKINKHKCTKEELEMMIKGYETCKIKTNLKK